MAVVVVVIVRAQRDTMVLREFINPDEGDVLAGGRRAALSLIPFKDFTSFTYGPLWPFTLGSLHRLGMPLTLPMAHVLNAVATCGVCIALARTIWRRWNLALAVVTVIPLAIHWSKGFYSQDFYSLSTEVLPLVFLVAACTVSCPARPISHRRAVVGALLFGCAVWSKYSFVFIVAVGLLALVVTMVASGHDVRRALFTCVAAPVLPLAVLAGWATLAGVPEWKITETFRIALSYAGNGGLAQVSPSLGERVRAVLHAASMFRSLLPLAILLAVALVAGIVHDRGASWRVTRLADLPHRSLIRVLAVLSVFAALGSLGTLVPIFPHYTYLFIAGMCQATFLLASIPPAAAEHRTDVAGGLLVGAALAAAWALPPVLQRAELPLYRWSRGTEAATTWSRVFTSQGGRWERGYTSDGRPLSQLCAPGSRVMVWGWSPDLYSQYDWTPATRYVITTPAMIEGTRTDSVDTYRARLYADFRAETPACVIDGASQALFPSWGTDRSLDAQWPALVNELSASYTRQTVVLHGYSPLTVWVRDN